MEEGGETREAARWSARAAYWAGGQPTPRRAAAVAAGDGAGRRAGGGRGDDGAGGRLAPAPARLRLAARDGQRGGSAAGRRGGGDRDAERRPALAGDAADWPPRLAPASIHEAQDWLAGVAEANRLADESGRPAPAGRDARRRRLRLPLRRRLRRLRAGARRSARAGRRRPRRRRRDRDRLPGRLGDDGQGPGAARARRIDEAEELFDAALRIADRGGRSRDGELDPRQPARCCWRCRAKPRRAWRWRGATAS